MALRIRTVRDLDEQAAAFSAIGHYFGWVPTREDAERFRPLLPVDRMHAVFDGGEIVAGAGAFPFGLTVPGGALPCAGVTVVGVLPSHRRRGLLRRMMDTQLRDVRERGEPIAALWASEETIYGRFGYGLASISHNVDAERRSVAIRSDLPRNGSMRLVTSDEALRTFPRLYERVGRARPGMIVRTRDWWSIRRLDDRPEIRRGGGPLVCALLERDGRPVGYALYRLVQEGSTPETWTKTIRVGEAFGVDDAATRDVWRFLLQIDWTDRVVAYHLPVDHPLPLLVDRINKLRLSVWDALWLRVVDVPAALAGRTYAVGRPRHDRGRVRPALPGERRPLDDRRRRGAPHAPPPRRAGGRRRARLRVSRRDLVRAARPCRTGRRDSARRHRTGRRGVSRAGGALVPRDLLIVVTGASGHVGGLVARELARRGVPLRAVTRNVERVPDLGGVEVALAGYDEPDTLMDALEPGDRVFMVSMHEPPERRIALHRGFIDVAARRRVAHVVYLSFVGAGPDASFVHARSHGATETMLAESGPARSRPCETACTPTRSPRGSMPRGG